MSFILLERMRLECRKLKRIMFYFYFCERNIEIILTFLKINFHSGTGGSSYKEKGLKEVC